MKKTSFPILSTVTLKKAKPLLGHSNKAKTPKKL